MDARNLKYINAFNILFEGAIGTLKKIENKFNGDWERAWNMRGNKEINIEREWTSLRKSKIDIITVYDNNYPALLKQIHDPPFILYVRGSKEALQSNCFSIVGTRSLTEYGKRITTEITGDLTRVGMTIVSGLARGIDAVAHQAAIEARGTAIAILPSGIDDMAIYPRQNFGLAQRILKTGGAIISEYPPGFRPYLYSFPLRNRIISGISKGTLIVEADLKSGSLITAHSAIDQNRDVFAVPGSIYSRTSRGVHAIIQKGAKLVNGAEDILEEYGLSISKIPRIITADNEYEVKILKVMTTETMTTNDIIRLTGLNAAEVNMTLVMMELNKKVRNLGNNKFARFI